MDRIHLNAWFFETIHSWLSFMCFHLRRKKEASIDNSHCDFVCAFYVCLSPICWELLKFRRDQRTQASVSCHAFLCPDNSQHDWIFIFISLGIWENFNNSSLIDLTWYHSSKSWPNSKVFQHAFWLCYKSIQENLKNSSCYSHWVHFRKVLQNIFLGVLLGRPWISYKTYRHSSKLKAW